MKTESAALARIKKGNLCSGCGGCRLVAPDSIEMQMSNPGFLRPVQIAPLTEAQEAQISEICPGLGQTVSPGVRSHDVLWGPYIAMHSGNATDSDLRFAASSGGALSAALVHLLESGMVDGVVQTGAAETPPYANAPVLSHTAQQVLRAAGSRYAPSAPLAGLGDHLNGDRRLAFVGKPCDVAALRALATKDSRVNRVFPVMLSFFCAGVPSQSGTEEVIRALDADPVETTAFRYRGHGWPGRATATRSDGSTVSMTYHESWGKILSRHVQHRCKVCADGTGTAADLVCADAWHCDERGYPLFEEQDGVSLIVARTDVGARLLADAVAAERITIAPFDPVDLAAMQPGQTRRRQALLFRLAALRLFLLPVPRYAGLHLFAAARGAPFTWALRNFLGMVRRILKRQAP